MSNPELLREDGRGPLGSSGTASSPDNTRIPICTPGALGINDKTAVRTDAAAAAQSQPHGQLCLNHRTFIEASSALPDSAKFAIGFGNIRFVALDAGKGLARTTRQFTREQRFIKCATPWEKKHSPLALDPHIPAVSGPITRVGSPFWPIVDESGTVIGYYGAVHHSNVGIRGQSTSDSKSPKPIIWLAPGQGSPYGGDLAVAVVDIDGNILTYQMTDRALEDRTK